MEQRLVDANKLIEKAYWHGDTPSYGKPYTEGHDAVDVEEIENSPTIDAVQVVRCKDCKYRDEEITIPAPDESPYESFTFASCPCKSFNLGDDFFCGKGERKDGDLL